MKRHWPEIDVRSNPGRCLSAVLLLAATSLAAFTTGCASFTNPVANGVPVNLVPEEFLAESKEGRVLLPLTTLRQPAPESYQLAAGDTLGVYVEGILGNPDTPPPVNVSEAAELPPSIGYPIPVREDGTVSLPLAGAVKVAGMTIENAEQAVVNAYLAKQVVQPDNYRIIVTLMRPRHVRVLVMREDSQQRQLRLQTSSLRGLGTSETTIGGGGQGTGDVLELPAYENDVLNALARTGGLPGLESTQEVIIQRGYWNANTDGQPACFSWPSQADLDSSGDNNRITRIPLRIRPGQPLSFSPQDVILDTGDIVLVRGRDPEFFYTAGLLPSSEIPLPNDYDLTVVEAVLKARGPLINGGINSSNLNGAIVGSGIGNPSPGLLTILRKVPGGGQVPIRVDLNEALRDPRHNILVQADDVLVLQESPNESFARYVTQVFQFDILLRFINRQDGQGAASVFLP